MKRRDFVKLSAASLLLPAYVARGQSHKDAGPTGRGTVQSQGHALYDLGKLPAELDPPVWPRQPDAAKRVTVRSYRAFAGAIRSGNDITVDASYADSGLIRIGPNVSDLRITFESGAVHTGDFAIAGQRVHIRGPGVRPGSWGATKATVNGAQIIGSVRRAPGASPTDIILQNLALDCDRGAFVWTEVERLAILGTRCNGGVGCLFVSPARPQSDIIVAGNDWFCNGRENPARFQNLQRIVSVENIFDANTPPRGPSTKHTLRHHTQCGEVYNGRNLYLGSGWTCVFPRENVAGVSGDFWFEDETFYIADTWVLVLNYTPDQFTGNGRAHRNRYYANSSRPPRSWFPESPDAMWTEVSDNTYEGTFASFPTSNPHWRA